MDLLVFFFPKFNGTIFELQAAPISAIEMIIGFVGATASKSILLGTLIILTSSFFIDLRIAHPLLMIFFLIITSVTFSMFGFIIGIWANNFEKLSLIPSYYSDSSRFFGRQFLFYKYAARFLAKNFLIKSRSLFSKWF